MRICIVHTIVYTMLCIEMFTHESVYISIHPCVNMLVSQTRTKIIKVGSRHTIYLEKAFVEDSLFPFKPNQPLSVRIDKNRLIIERNLAQWHGYVWLNMVTIIHWDTPAFYERKLSISGIAILCCTVVMTNVLAGYLQSLGADMYHATIQTASHSLILW